MTQAPQIIIDLPAWAYAVTRTDQTYPSDEEKMAAVLRLARENVERGTGGPFAAGIFELESGRLVAVGVNSVVRLQNSAVHAEMLAIMLAQQEVQSFTLRARGRPTYDLVTSCEPCAMCLGATLWSGVSRVVIGARREDAMELGFDEGPVFPESYAYLEARGLAFVRDVAREAALRVLHAYRDRGGTIYNAGTA
jgi:tRNA(Arg) A34 adenosine deaminase TadA